MYTIGVDIQLTSDGIEIDERIRKMVTEKVGDELEKYLSDFEPDFKKATVRIEKNSRHGYTVHIDMRLPGSTGHLFAKESGDDLTNLLIAIRHEIERQLRDYKDRLQDYR